jgi:hypothetical protein
MTGLSVQGATGVLGPTGLRGPTGVQGVAGATGPRGITPNSQSFFISEAGGIDVGPYVLFKTDKNITITSMTVSMVDSGSGGSLQTRFEIHKIASTGMPSSPLIGLGNASVIVPAVGVGVMNVGTVSSLTLSYSAGDFIFISTSAVPSSLGNRALITIYFDQ